MSETIRISQMAVAVTIALAGCQSRSADAPDAGKDEPMLAGASLRETVAGHSIVPEPGAPGFCQYLDPARYDYSFDDPGDIDQFLGWRVEGDDLCIYNGAVLDCYSVALPGAGLIALGPQDGEPTATSRLVEGNPCAA